MIKNEAVSLLNLSRLELGSPNEQSTVLRVSLDRLFPYFSTATLFPSISPLKDTLRTLSASTHMSASEEKRVTWKSLQDSRLFGKVGYNQSDSHMLIQHHFQALWLQIANVDMPHDRCDCGVLAFSRTPDQRNSRACWKVSATQQHQNPNSVWLMMRTHPSDSRGATEHLLWEFGLMPQKALLWNCLKKFCMVFSVNASLSLVPLYSREIFLCSDEKWRLDI